MEEKKQKQFSFWKKCLLADLLGLFLVAVCMLGCAGRGAELKNTLKMAVNLQENTKGTKEQGTKGLQDTTGEMKKIAITFDDGPHPVYTQELLDGLKERGVHATFFVTGEHAELHPDIIKRMKKEGHLIGNHTYSHIQLGTSNREKFKMELVETNQVIKEITGEEVQYVRPPYGTWDKTFEKELNMFPVLWTVDPLDWCSGDASCVVQKVLGKAKENDIILLHDYYGSSITAALEIIDQLQKKGFQFVTVEEIMFD